MAETKISFDDGAAYDRFMGRWSKAVGTKFLDWLKPPTSAKWLDVGCGTGAFTQLIFDQCAPASIAGIDPSAAQIEQAQKGAASKLADFRVGDAMALPHPDATFDVVISALVINFVPDRNKALAEMRRVAKPGGIVASYLWDRSADTEFSPTAPMQRGFRDMGADAPRIPGADMSSLKALAQAAGLEATETMPIEVTQTYRDFDDYWESQTPAFSPAARLLATMPESNRKRLRDSMRERMPGADGSVTYASRAVAFKAKAPA